MMCLMLISNRFFVLLHQTYENVRKKLFLLIDMAIQVTYRRTRRLSMRIVKNGDVHVSAPIGMPKKEVERFIDEHREWIAEARKKTYESQKRRADFYNKLPLKTRE